MINSFVLPEGKKSVIYALIITVLLFLFVCDFLGWIALIITFTLVYVYRNSAKPAVIVSDIVSPCSGKVSAIDVLDGKKIIYVDVSLCDSSILRAPISESFEVLENRKGLNLSSDSFRATKLNNKVTLKFGEIVISLLAGRCNLKTSLNTEAEPLKGEKIGVFTSGKIQIILDKNNVIKVKIGQKIEAGVTPLA